VRWVGEDGAIHKWKADHTIPVQSAEGTTTPQLILQDRDLPIAIFNFAATGTEIRSIERLVGDRLLAEAEPDFTNASTPVKPPFDT
jgi:hypothetical protein